MRFLKLLCLTICLSLAATPAWAATATPTNSHVFSGNIVFGAGGMSGRFIVLDAWLVDQELHAQHLS